MSKSGSLQDNKLFQTALADVAPKWRIFDFITTTPQLCWEYARRNHGFIEKSRKFEQFIKAERQKDLEVMKQIIGDEEITDFFDPAMILPYQYARHPETQKIAKEYGMTFWQSPEQDVFLDSLWDTDTNVQNISEKKLEAAFDRENRVINNLYLSPIEDAVIMRGDLPFEAFLKQAQKKYKAIRQNTGSPNFQIKRHLEYLMVYDLRQWGEQDGRKVRKKGGLQSCINWAWIAEYLNEQNFLDQVRPSLTVSGISQRYDKAVKYINGGYKDLLEKETHKKTEGKYRGVLITKSGKAELIPRKKK